MDIAEVKKHLGRKVIYNEAEYLFSGCIIRPDEKGSFFYQAELKDLKAKNSLAICRLSDISTQI